jgi:hypothetical protein
MMNDVAIRREMRNEGEKESIWSGTAGYNFADKPSGENT